MAFYDDRKFLLSYIHHSFITCDETGMCETAMLNEPITDRTLDPAPLLELSSRDAYDILDPGQSYDIVSGMGFIGGHRHRSNTAQRLEKLKRDRQAQAKITHIQWKDCPANLSETELSKLFPRKEVPKSAAKKSVKSALSEALELYPALPNNPFGEFARFDGRDNRSAPSKKITIYLTMQSGSDRNFGMEVVCLSNARVYDLVGLICWMYTNEGREPKLNSPVSNYCLKIAEETGEVDDDFPSLDANEFVGKFGFPYLALVEKQVKSATTSLVTMYLDNEMVKFEVPTLNLTLREVADLASQKAAITKASTYQIKTLEDSSSPLPLDTKLANFNSLAFRLVFEKTAKERLPVFEVDAYDAHMRAVEAPLYRSYNVTFCQKIGINYDVQLGISGEKVEINPLPQKGAAKLLSRQQRPTTLYMDTIATCEIIAKKYNPGRCTFKLIYQSEQDFRKFVFETDPLAAQDIVNKIQLILEMHSSSACKEYQLYRERKLQRKVLKAQQGTGKV